MSFLNAFATFGKDWLLGGRLIENAATDAFFVPSDVGLGCISEVCLLILELYQPCRRTTLIPKITIFLVPVYHLLQELRLLITLPTLHLISM